MTNFISRALGLGTVTVPVTVDIPPPPVPQSLQRSTVGALAMSLVASSQVKTKLIKGYVSKVEELSEELRQQRASQLALTSGLKSLAEDPALTDEEKKAVTTELQNHVEVELDKGIDEALKAEQPVMPAVKPLVIPPVAPSVTAPPPVAPAPIIPPASGTPPTTAVPPVPPLVP